MTVQKASITLFICAVLSNSWYVAGGIFIGWYIMLHVEEPPKQ